MILYWGRENGQGGAISEGDLNMRQKNYQRCWNKGRILTDSEYKRVYAKEQKKYSRCISYPILYNIWIREKYS